jgi:alkylmercury lyase
MTTPTAPGAIAIDEIADRLCRGVEDLDEEDQRVQLVLFGLLAEGEAVEPAQLAAAARVTSGDVIAALARWDGIHTDAGGRIVAFHGLSLTKTPHRLHIGNRQLYAWCAWDTLFLPELIGKPAEVESTCAVTGERITLRVGLAGAADVAPDAALLSLVLPASGLTGDPIASFCRFVRYLASPKAAAEYVRRNPRTFAVSIEDGFEIGRRTNARKWGRALRSHEAEIE